MSIGLKKRIQFCFIDWLIASFYVFVRGNKVCFQIWYTIASSVCTKINVGVFIEKHIGKCPFEGVQQFYQMEYCCT